jgi:hypothetical protein
MAGLVVGGAWLIPQHPFWGALVLAPVIALAIAQHRAWVAHRGLLDAANRCDLDAIEKYARGGSIMIRVEAISAFLFHGGFARDEVRFLCSCGECEKDEFEREFERLRKALHLSWSGRADDGAELAGATDEIDAAIPAHLHSFVEDVRLACRLVCGALRARSSVEGIEDLDATFVEVLGEVASETPWLVWPCQLAIARQAATRGRHAEARRFLEGMPAWPEHSRLERVRRELMADLQVEAVSDVALGGVGRPGQSEVVKR